MTTQDAFQKLAERHRSELLVHCYRMLGSFQDAEDCVQETYLRAWRGFDTYAGSGLVRNWLYKIATNTCLNNLSRRRRAYRSLPEDTGPPSHGMPQGKPSTEIAWLEPYPDLLLEGIPDSAPGPHALYELRESVTLAFVAAIQRLPPRQRAALLLCDVLGWTAADTASILESSAASVNSALQRARATLSQHRRSEPKPALDERQSALLDGYLRAWEAMDIVHLASLLREDTVLSMPPWSEWYLGREDICSFLADAWKSRAYGGFRLVPTAANGASAFAVYSRGRAEGAEWRPHSLHVIVMGRGGIAGVTMFLDCKRLEKFAALEI